MPNAVMFALKHHLQPDHKTLIKYKRPQLLSITLPTGMVSDISVPCCKFFPGMRSSSFSFFLSFFLPPLYLSLIHVFGGNHKIGSAGFRQRSYIGWPSFNNEICHGEIFHTLGERLGCFEGTVDVGWGRWRCIMLHGSESGNKRQVRQAGIDKMMLCRLGKQPGFCIYGVYVYVFFFFQLNK